MDRFLLQVFAAELETQCDFVVIGARQANEALSRNDVDDTWFAIQGVLSAAANASKLLWGTRHQPKDRRKDLREFAEVDESSPLRSRTLRDHFEHFDERIAEWFGNDSHKVYVGRNIGTPGGISLNGKEPEKQFGFFDTSKPAVTFWTDEVNLNDIVMEASRVKRTLQSKLPTLFAAVP